jgi:TonB family protein
MTLPLHSAIATLFLFAGTLTVRAQQLYGEGATFAEGPARHEVQGELTTIDVPEACVLWVAIGVDRQGKVVSAKVDMATSTCNDPAVHEKALRSVRGRKFNPEPQAPAVQQGRVRWVLRHTRSEFGDETIQGAVQEEDYQSPTDPYTIVEQMPEFPGGPEALKNYLAEQLKYPEVAKESYHQGVAYLTFVVELDGNLSGIKVIRGIGAGCDEEALRLVKGMPTWKPGKQNGDVVRVQYNLPIRFKLPKDQ